MIQGPAFDRVINQVRGVNVVGGQFRFELLDKLLILLGAFGFYVAPEWCGAVVSGELQPVGVEAGDAHIKAGSLKRGHFRLQDLLVGI